jgi:cob(I)alamin adenosyltransferase
MSKAEGQDPKDGLEDWRGDLGLTDLLGEKDILKFEPRIEALGQLDEASSALGLVRSCPVSDATKDMILDIQRDLCWMMSELAATTPEEKIPTHITPSRVHFLQSEFHRRRAENPLGDAFVVPGDSQSSAMLHLARSIVRRAERHVTLLKHQEGFENEWILPYLNRLSALLYVLARGEDRVEGRTSTRAHPSTRPADPKDQTTS